MTTTPTIYLLIGYPGTGKYTVGASLVEQIGTAGGNAVLVDNHYVNNPIFRLIGADGKSPLPDEVWERVAEVRNAVLSTVERLSPKDWSFVFTVWIAQGEEESEGYVARLKALAESRDSRFAVVRLVCETSALRERVPGADRAARLKWIDPDAVAALTTRHRLYEPSVESLTIDNTELEPAACAARILEYAAIG